MQKKYFVIIIAASLLLSCNKKTVTIITPVNETSNLSPKGLVYALPKTTLKICVEALQTNIIPGPYSAYAKKYLGITGAYTSAQSSWEISDVSVTLFNHADPKLLFAVEPNGVQIDYLSLTSEGLIIPAMLSTSPSTAQHHTITNSSQQNVQFLDLSPSPFIAAEKTTLYSKVLKDSTFTSVPVHKSVVVERSTEEKAREAADFIFSLRKRRFDLISGDADFIAEGKGVETVFREIDRLEKEYLSLFVGKVNEVKATQWFEYSPEPNGTEISTILFRFSKTKGIVPSSDLSASPVLVSVQQLEQWADHALLNQLSTEKGIQQPNAVYYRLPISASVRIHDSQTEYYFQSLPFYQLGPQLRMPARFIENNKGNIVFPAANP